jgi:hypothetical protein
MTSPSSCTAVLMCPSVCIPCALQVCQQSSEMELCTAVAVQHTSLVLCATGRCVTTNVSVGLYYSRQPTSFHLQQPHYELNGVVWDGGSSCTLTALGSFPTLAEVSVRQSIVDARFLQTAPEVVSLDRVPRLCGSGSVAPTSF